MWLAVSLVREPCADGGVRPDYASERVVVGQHNLIFIDTGEKDIDLLSRRPIRKQASIERE